VFMGRRAYRLWRSVCVSVRGAADSADHSGSSKIQVGALKTVWGKGSVGTVFGHG